MSTSNRPPSHLSKPSRDWYAAICRDWELDVVSLRELVSACEAWDRKEDARRRLKREGLTMTDRFGQEKVHPCVAIERDARIAFHRACRELGLEGEPDPGAYGRRRPGQRSHND